MFDDEDLKFLSKIIITVPVGKNTDFAPGWQ